MSASSTRARRRARAPARLSRLPRAAQRQRAGARASPSACRWRSPSLRRPACAWPLLALASLVQTIPGLALLALFYPLLLALRRSPSALFGLGFSALGFLPSLLALTLYSMLPILRNTVTGIIGVDPAVKRGRRRRRHDAAAVAAAGGAAAGAAGDHGRRAHRRGLGHRRRDALHAVGQTSLGNYIFAGLQTQNWIFVLFGCVAAAVLALVVDQLLALMERGSRERGRAPRGALGGAGPRF